MLDYPALAAVAAVVREGSFERAASVLGVTASAVSQRVRALEERLGAVLVVRSQPCTATATGARLCAHVERVRLLEGEMVTTLPTLASAASHEGPPTVRVAVNADSLGAWFLPAVVAFAEQSGALVDLVLDAEEHTADRLRSGEVLAAVTADTAPVQLDLNTGSEKELPSQQLTSTYVALSTTGGGAGLGSGDQAALVSARMLGGSAMRAALNSGPMTPVAGVRRVRC